jgi:hypothetical protein
MIAWRSDDQAVGFSHLFYKLALFSTAFVVSRGEMRKPGEEWPVEKKSASTRLFRCFQSEAQGPIGRRGYARGSADAHDQRLVWTRGFSHFGHVLRFYPQDSLVSNCRATADNHDARRSRASAIQSCMKFSSSGEHVGRKDADDIAQRTRQNTRLEEELVKLEAEFRTLARVVCLELDRGHCPNWANVIRETVAMRSNNRFPLENPQAGGTSSSGDRISRVGMAVTEIPEGISRTRRWDWRRIESRSRIMRAWVSPRSI